MPIIDSRNFEEFLKEKKDIIPFYTPEWHPTNEKDAGLALLKIFVHMQEEIIKRINRVPERNFTAFLEMLGITLLPAQPAKIPVTFHLSEGLSDGVFVPACTQVSTEETGESGPLIFETTKNFFAASALIEEFYCVDPQNDAIYICTADLKNNKEFLLFTGENQQEHILYIGHSDFFKVKGPVQIHLKFQFVPNKGSIGDLKYFTWEYFGQDGNPESFETPTIEADTLILDLQTGEITEKEIHGRKSHWILCKMEKIIGNSLLPVITEIKIKNITSASKPIDPDAGFYNSTSLDLSKKFYPFGRQPRIYDTFYIASKYAFTKKNAEITITINITAASDTDEPQPEYVELSWEYWNGRIWQALEIEEVDTDNDNGTIGNFSSIEDICFTCPEDMKEINVNGEVNYWIRVRLVNGNYGKNIIEPEVVVVDGHSVVKWKVVPHFNPPKINEITIDYQFPEEGNAGTGLEYCLAYNNLEYRDFSLESRGSTDGFMPFTPLLETHPTCYIGFNNAFKKGNISMFFLY